uniref:Uncharacterized protein n=1 Tax=Romanomermis culicivorax TaxID=13658 RepID=A0A915J2P2_ROMCU
MLAILTTEIIIFNDLNFNPCRIGTLNLKSTFFEDAELLSVIDELGCKSSKVFVNLPPTAIDWTTPPTPRPTLLKGDDVDWPKILRRLLSLIVRLDLLGQASEVLHFLNIKLSDVDETSSCSTSILRFRADETSCGELFRSSALAPAMAVVVVSGSGFSLDEMQEDMRADVAIFLDEFDD